jgi:hypothetical protein
MNESGERASNDKAARSTRTEIREPICAIARGALSLHEPLKHIVKKRVLSTRHCEPTGPAFDPLARNDGTLQHRQAAWLGAARKRLIERGEFLLAQRQAAGPGIVGGVPG